MTRVPAGAILLVVAVTFGVLISVSVPADGVRVDVDTSETAVTQGEFITFTTEVVIRDGEAIPIDSIELRLEGEQSSTVTFEVDGTERTSRPWVRSIDRTFDNASYAVRPSRYGYDERTDENVSFGSGRGYGDNAAKLPGALRYEITVDTSTLATGDYRVETRVVASDGTTAHEYSSAAVPFTIEGTLGTAEATGPVEPPVDDTQGEESGFAAADVAILAAVLVVLFAAGYFSAGPAYEWYRNR